MIDRCMNPKDDHYKWYGARGITVCDEWLEFAPFRDWAMENGYDAHAEFGKCTIDRIDNDKGYSPVNCRFVDMKVQSNNRRNSRNKEVSSNE